MNKDSALAWFERGHAYLLGRDWKRAEEDLGQALKIDRSFGPAWHHRGYARAALGQWKEAAGDLAEAVKRPGVTTEALSHHALLCLHLHDTEGYRKACQTVFRHSTPQLPVGRMDGNAVPAKVSSGPGGLYFQVTSGRTDLNDLALAAWTCAVGPDSGVDPSKTAWTWDSIMHGRSAKPYNPYFVHRAAGAVLYRAGKFEAAIGKLHEALDAARRAGQEGTPTAWLLLAMAEHRRKDPVKARAWLEKARVWTGAARKPMPGPDGAGGVRWDNIPWPERLALELLQAEAKRLIEGDAPKP